MNRYYVESACDSFKLFVMAYSEKHVRDMFIDYNLITVDQTD